MIWKLSIVIALGLYLLGAVLLYLFQERVMFFPKPLPNDFQYEFEAPFEEHFLQAEDGARLNYLHFKPASAKGVILYFHGNAGNLVRWGEVVLPFVDRGYEVIIMDYRSFGKNSAKRDSRLMLRDAEQFYALARESWNEEQIIVFGRSLGSSFASHVTGLNNPKMLILETPFSSIGYMANRMAPIYPTSVLIRFDYDNCQSLRNSQVPVYLFHGTDDRIVPIESGQLLFESISAKKELIILENGGHNDLAEFETYWNTIDSIL